MDHLFKCLAALLLAFNLGVNGVIYRTVQLEAGLNAELPCHELEDVAALKMWVTPNRGFVTVDYIPDSEHYAIDANSGSLYVNVSPENI